jgi:hypothetical protein
MPTAALAPFNVRLKFINEDTNEQTYVTNVTASYDAFDFLCVTASLALVPNDFYAFTIEQLTGSAFCTELYRGEILPTSESATVRTSEPLLSYDGADNEYIIYEY